MYLIISQSERFDVKSTRPCTALLAVVRRRAEPSTAHADLTTVLRSCSYHLPNELTLLVVVLTYHTLVLRFFHHFAAW